MKGSNDRRKLCGDRRREVIGDWNSRRSGPIDKSTCVADKGNSCVLSQCRADGSRRDRLLVRCRSRSNPVLSADESITPKNSDIHDHSASRSLGNLDFGRRHCGRLRDSDMHSGA